MDKLLRDQLRLYDMLVQILEDEENKLRDSYGVARNLACSEWSDSLVPSASGGHYIKQPTRLLSDKTVLLRDNFYMLLEDIIDRRSALKVLFEPVFKSVSRSM